MSEQNKVHITIFQAPYASLLEHKLDMKMHDPSRPFEGVVPAEYYLPVFHGEIDCPTQMPSDPGARERAILEYVFFLFNNAHPAGYCARSLSVGDVVRLEGRDYLCAVSGFDPITFQSSKESHLVQENEHCCQITLPGGSTLRATAYQESEFPCINIDLVTDDGESSRVCFVEHNPEKEAGHELYIGVYCASEADTVYYDSFFKTNETES